MPSRLLLVGLVLFFLGCQAGSGGGGGRRRYSREQASASLQKLEGSGLALGIFAINGSDAVLDGDTIEVMGLDASLRLLAIDTEETFKHQNDKQAYHQLGFETYMKNLRGNSPRPVKAATPMGEEAKKYAQKFFEGVTRVRLERDHPGEIRDYYNRYLAYVFVERDGKWVNYGIEAVKAGMTPYFDKYGRSRRFHEQFVLAQKKAQEKKLGIWNDQTEHYLDYPERLAWWSARSEAIFQFEIKMEQHDNHIALTRFNALEELQRRVGKEVVLLASVSEVMAHEKGPTIVRLSRSRSTGFDVVFFERGVFEKSLIGQCGSEFVQVRGVVAEYADKRTGQKRLQIIVNKPEQVTPCTTRLAAAPPTKADESE